MVKPRKRQRQSGELLCASIILVLGLLYVSDAAFAILRQQPFRMTHEGYLVTDSPWIGGVLGTLLIALSAYIFFARRTSQETQDDHGTPTI